MSEASLKIAYVLKRFPRLSETFVLNEILELERQGVEIEIFSLLKPPAEGRHTLLDELKAPVHYLPSTGACNGLKVREGLDAVETRLGDVADNSSVEGTGFIDDPILAAKTREEVVTLHLKAATLALLVRMRGISHMHAHFGSDATTVALLAGRISGVGFSYTAHARDIYHLYASEEADAAMRRAKIAEAAFVATVSDYNVAHLSKIAPQFPGKVRRVYNGVDLTRLTPTEGQRQVGAILAVGRLIEKKGLSVLIDACAELAAKGRDFTCKIIGEGPLRPALEAQIFRLGLQDRIALVGARTHDVVLAEMASANVLAAPFVIAESGDRDGLPTVLLEAMALGAPVVSTTVTGAPEIVEAGEAGLLVPPGDAPALAEAIGAILGDPVRAAAMGRAGRRRAEALFDLKSNVAQLRAMFAEAAGKRAGAFVTAA